MLHRLCGPPSIPLSFSLATVLPRRGTYCVSSGTDQFSCPTPSAHRLRRGLPGYLIPFAPHALAPQRQCSSRMPPSPLTFFLISTHFTAPLGIPLPLRHSSRAVCTALPRLSRGLSRCTHTAAYARFTPSNSEQRLPPPSYRGCWHGVSRGFLHRYRHRRGPLRLPRFVPVDRALHPERRRHSHGVAASGLPPLRKIPHCCLP